MQPQIPFFKHVEIMLKLKIDLLGFFKHAGTVPEWDILQGVSSWGV